ncbi:ribonuclease H-like domain-containing protein [Tanacetum coccineum]|uniref:Ribonuclease H-like domain-containing protein n=1 Tax=Tanacetum coccineum TaxID=301880 RepID=A0ABQ5HLD0_9ASTR
MNNTSAPIIKDWNSDDESEVEPNDKTITPSTEKIKSVKTVRETNAPKQNKHHPKRNQRNWNNLMSQRLGSDFKAINKACFVCGSFDHLKKDCSKRMGRHEHEPEFDFDAANVPVTTAGAVIRTASPKIKIVGDSIEDIAAETLVYIKRSAAKAKDKGKSKMEESKSAMTKTKRQQEQERLGFEVSVRLQAELDKEERQRISRAGGLIQELLQKIFIQAERSRR